MSPTATGSVWLPYNAEKPKKRRSQRVCTVCHSKKVKCDLEERENRGHSDCTYCSQFQKQCRVRKSRRQGAPQRRRSPELSSGDHGNRDDVSSNVGNQDCHFVMDTIVSSSQFGSRPNGTLNGDNNTLGGTELGGTNQPFDIPSLQATLATSRWDSDDVDNTVNQTEDVDTGFLNVYRREQLADAELQALQALKLPSTDGVGPELLHIFVDTYYEYCYTWCPVLDSGDLTNKLSQSPLLANALALASSHIQPPMLPHDGPARYYNTARRLFYEDEEPDQTTSLQAILLFYWWAPRSPSMVHRHTSWWWTSVVIRHAQQMNFHRETPHHSNINTSLRRRIWWTAYARERLTALCQSTPAIINCQDCNIPELSLDDFDDIRPQDRQKAQVFIHWVSLCSILGEMAECLHRSNEKDASGLVPQHLGDQLKNWIQTLPSHLALSIGSAYSAGYHRDVHQLHLPYLTAVIVLHLKKAHGPLPDAPPQAILAASCVARILKDILARGGIRFLMPITSWYCGMAFIALLRATKDSQLAAAAHEDLDVIVLATDQLRQMWASSNVIYQGFDRLKAAALKQPTVSIVRSPTMATDRSGLSGLHQSSHSEPSNTPAISWKDYFPFVERHTSKLAELLLNSVDTQELFDATDFLTDFPFQMDLQSWFDPFFDLDFKSSENSLIL